MKLRNKTKIILNFIKNIETIPGCQYLAWYQSIAHSTSGYFLYTCPKNNDLTFNNIEFSTTISLRLFCSETVNLPIFYLDFTFFYQILSKYD